MQKLANDQALKLVQAGDVEDHAGFDTAEARRLGLTPGQTVAVTPTDTGKRALYALISCTSLPLPCNAQGKTTRLSAR